MTELAHNPTPEIDEVTNQLNSSSERIFEALPPTFSENAWLDMQIDGVEIKIAVNQSWYNGDTAFDVITSSLDDDGMTISSGYHWRKEHTNTTTEGNYSVTKLKPGERGGISMPYGDVRTEKPTDPSMQETGRIGKSQAQDVEKILDLYFKGVQLAEEEKAKRELFTERSFGGYILDIVQGSRLQLRSTNYLSSLASRNFEETALLLGLSNEEIRTRIVNMGDKNVSVTDEEIDSLRVLMQQSETN